MKVLEFLKKLDNNQKIKLVSAGWSESGNIEPDFEGEVEDFKIPAKFADTAYFGEHVQSICVDDGIICIRYIGRQFKPEVAFRDDTVFNFLTISTGNVAVVHAGTDRLTGPEWIGLPNEMPFDFSILTKKVQKIRTASHGLVFEV